MAKLVYNKQGRLLFTEEMRREYTILIPQMLPVHFTFLEKIFNNHGYKVKLLTSTGRKIVDEGLRNVQRYLLPCAAGHRSDDGRSQIRRIRPEQDGSYDYPDRRRMPRFKLYQPPAESSQKQRYGTSSSGFSEPFQYGEKPRI